MGDYFERFIAQQIKTGKYTSASEVVLEASRLLEFEQSKKTELINELKKGEVSGIAKDFDRQAFLTQMYIKHADKK